MHRLLPIFLLACAPTLEEGTWGFELLEVTDDTCGFTELSRDDVELSLTDEGFETVDDEGNAAAYTVSGKDISASYSLDGELAGGSCTFGIAYAEQGTIEDPQSFTLEAATEIEPGDCTTMQACATTAQWQVTRR